MVGQWQDLGSVNIWDGSIINQLSLLFFFFFIFLFFKF